MKLHNIAHTHTKSTGRSLLNYINFHDQSIKFLHTSHLARHNDLPEQRSRSHNASGTQSDSTPNPPQQKNYDQSPTLYYYEFLYSVELLKFF